MKNNEEWGISTRDAIQKLSTAGTEMLNLSNLGNLSLDIYKPKGSDKQKPHDRDEVYIVISGNGILNTNGKRTDCKQGDLFYVPAGMDHRFEGFSNDFSTWVIFSGNKLDRITS
jgi:mannose-6-phosphate isomerase-like protein (cupin superfamily)